MTNANANSIDTFFKFSIDGHNFTVISTDFVPIEPYETTNLSIAIGTPMPPRSLQLVPLKPTNVFSRTTVLCYC